MDKKDAYTMDGLLICPDCDNIYKLGREKLHDQTNPHKEAVASRERASR